EVNHLPPTNSNTFQLMKQFFRIVLNSNNAIYTWGTINELDAFVQFNLFNADDIKLSMAENLQSFFKMYWNKCHQHKRTEDCLCENCLKKKTTDTWKLQDAVAYQLHEWLDKRHTCSPFDIGLDPRLNELNPEQLEYRTTLINYAADDCLAMEKLMIDM